MWPFKREVPAPASEPAREPIVFRADDDMFRRAENIWYGLGFANDRFDNITKIAAWLQMYQKWDSAAPLGKCFECGKPLSVFCPACCASKP